MKCVDCGGAVKEKKIRYVDLGVDLGEFHAGVCEKCGEQYFSSQTAQKIQDKQKEAGIWGLSSETEVAEYGNSLSIRVKKKLAEFLKLKKGTKVEIKLIEPKKFVVEVIG